MQIVRKEAFASVELVVFDFDGVFTNNKVYVSESGQESVRCDRSDSLGIDYMRRAGVPMLVLSTEGNSVVEKRCAKMQLTCVQGIDRKIDRLSSILLERDISWSAVAYIGNDLNDEECMRKVGFSVAPADSHERILSIATTKLGRCGGDGAVREFVETFLDI